jgi:hypothetical protein
MFRLKRLTQEGVSLEIDHPNREVVTGLPKGVSFLSFFVA